MTTEVASRLVAVAAGAVFLATTAGCAIAEPGRTQAVVPVLAFPGAEGAGRLSLGGRGGAVLRVVNLNDSGPGSLRAAIETAGPRTVVFDVGGTIRLASPLTVRHGRLTVAGQTAPGGGVTVRDHPLVIAADDVVVRYLRARLGDESGVEADAISITRGRRIILDHVSASWSLDETLSVASRYDPPERGVYDVTVQWSIIAESLNKSGHAKGDHGYGSLVRGAHGARFTFHHNLWASHRARMPRPGNYLTPDVDPVGPMITFTNNVFYNWGGERAGYNADSDPATLAAYAFIANAYRRGPDSSGAVIFEEESPLARAWFEANSLDGATSADPWDAVTGDDTPGYRLPGRPDWAMPPAEAAEQAYASVLAKAGASHVRDAVDARVVADVIDGDGGVIDSQNNVGGWPRLAPGVPWIDSDGDGMPDDWERDHGHDPSAPDGTSDRDGDGFTHLEDWLNGLVA